MAAQMAGLTCPRRKLPALARETVLSALAKPFRRAKALLWGWKTITAFSQPLNLNNTR